MIAVEFASTGDCEMSVFHGLSVANGRNPFKLESWPVVIAAHALGVWGGAGVGVGVGTGVGVGVGTVPGGLVELPPAVLPPQAVQIRRAANATARASLRITVHLASPIIALAQMDTKTGRPTAQQESVHVLGKEDGARSPSSGIELRLTDNQAPRDEAVAFRLPITYFPITYCFLLGGDPVFRPPWRFHRISFSAATC